METRILAIFTRTPLHVGAGSSVGAIDLPIVRERHTRLPIIPGTSLKGVLADLWHAGAESKRGDDAAWLFGSEDAKAASAGALLIGEGKLLAFPVRSAKGAFAWITCPLVLARYKRDVNAGFDIPRVDGEACLAVSGVKLENQAVLEEYALEVKGDVPSDLIKALAGLNDDTVWQQLANKLVVVSDELFSYFAENACETAQHIKIDDQTGTVARGALFNQENVPSETLFYSVIHAQGGKGAQAKSKAPTEAIDALSAKLSGSSVLNTLQIGGDVTTGLGWCSVALKEVN